MRSIFLWCRNIAILWRDLVSVFHSVKLLWFLRLLYRQQLGFKKYNLRQRSDAFILTGCNGIQVSLKSGI